jgi:exoribonuclease II
VDKGTIIEFRQGSDRRLGVLDRPEGKKNWLVVDERGNSKALNPREFAFVLEGSQLAPTALTQFREQVEALLDPETLAVAWEMLVDEAQCVELATLADLLFSADDAVEQYATYRLLEEDRLYFKQRKEAYEPRSRDQVEAMRHQQAIAAERQQQWQAFLERCRTRIQGTIVEWLAADQVSLSSVERLATLGEETASQNRTQALELLAALHYPESAAGAFRLMVDLGLWSLHENLYLRRSQVPMSFSAQVLDMAAARSGNSWEAHSQRLDLSHLKVYTIDDESTREIDDGISLERLTDGRQRLWVHIADPTRLIEPGDVLDLEARRRGTTIYLPTGIVPMFPEVLATGPMSLVQGQACYALSFAVLLTPEGSVEDFDIQATLIRPTYRLTYEDVDEMLDLGVTGESELLDLWRWAQIRQQWRQQQGAIAIQMPEASIKVSADDDISIAVLEESPARQLVAEMMILAGATAGLYGQHHNLPLPFRGQPQPELPPEEELLALPAGPVRACALRRCMPRSEVSLTPSRHASLGLDAYSQVTSPIRRYSDLLAHFQIKAHLRGEVPPFDSDSLQQLVSSASAISYEAVQVERQTNRYWVLEYLRRQGDRPWQALVLRWLREHEGLALVLLEDLGVELPARLVNRVGLGDRLQLRVAQVEPRQELIHFEEVS